MVYNRSVKLKAIGNMTKIIPKKRGISKKNKKSWRKHTDIKDVENFLDDQRLEERLGGSFNKRENKELFVIDNTSNAELLTKVTNKKQRAALPPRCFEILKPWTSVPDPITKRNRVRSREERKSAIRKLIEETKKKSGFVKKKDLIAKQSRERTKALKQNVPKRGEFNMDLWQSEETENPLGDSEWLEEETNRHVLKNTGKLKVRNPKTYAKTLAKALPSGLAATEAPHPGMSYNPSFSDHQQLLKSIADKELQLMKEEEHLDRVTSNMFSKISPQENQSRWMSEMSEGLEKTKGDDENGGEYQAINPPTSFMKKKTLKTRRKQKEAKKEAHNKQKLRTEKKKTADIYKLRMLEKEIIEKEKKLAAVKEKRAKKKASEVNRTKKLGKKKFEEPELEFNRPHEIAGNLRGLKPEGNILTDRFFSMQKRNVLEVTAKQLKSHRRKVKKFVKPSHRIEEPIARK